MAEVRSKKMQVWSSVVLLVVVGFLLGAYFLWMAQRDDPDPAILTSPNVAQSEMDVMYKTFANEEYGFRVQYPQEWFVEESTSGTGSGSIYSVQLRGDSYGITISVMPETLESIVRNSISIQQETQIDVRGRTGTRLTGTDAHDGSPYSVVLIRRDETLFAISGGGQMFDEVVNYFELI